MDVQLALILLVYFLTAVLPLLYFVWKNREFSLLLYTSFFGYTLISWVLFKIVFYPIDFVLTRLAPRWAQEGSLVGWEWIFTSLSWLSDNLVFVMWPVVLLALPPLLHARYNKYLTRPSI